MMKSGHEIRIATEAGRCKTRNRQSLLRVALMVGVSAALATTAPAGLALPTFSSLLLIGSLIAAGAALVMTEKPMAAHLTRWDEAAALLGLSILAGVAVDPVAAQQALLELAPLEQAVPALP